MVITHPNRFSSDFCLNSLTGWWYVSSPLKINSQLGLLFPIYGKITHVPNHQPDIRLIDGML